MSDDHCDVDGTHNWRPWYLRPSDGIPEHSCYSCGEALPAMWATQLVMEDTREAE